MDRETEEALTFLYGSQEPEGPFPKARNAFPAYRVFVYGFEVTEDVTNINIKGHVGRQPNSCSISLLNERDKYLMTTEDMFFLTGIDPSLVTIRSRDLGVVSIGTALSELATERSETAGARAPDELHSQPDSVLLNYRMANPESVKSKIFFLKQKHRILVSPEDARGIRQGTMRQSRYPFADGVPIFHPNDPVRVFVRDVFDSQTWYYGFSGFLTDISDDVSINNQKVINISAEDPTKLFRYARIFGNPSLLDENTRVPGDEVNYSSFTNPLASKTLVEIINYVVWGVQREPVFESLVLAPPAISEDEAQLHAIQAGLVEFDTSQLPANATLAQIRAAMTADQNTQLDNYIARRRHDLEKLQEIRQEAFQIDFWNRFDKHIVRRYGTSGVGSFKPARSRDRAAIRAAVEENLLSYHAPVQAPGPRVEEELAPLGPLAEEPANPAGATQPATFETRLRNARIAMESPARGAHVYGLSLAPADRFPEGIERISLQQWESIISWQVQLSDFQTLLNKDVDAEEFARDLPQRLGKPISQATIEDVVTVIGEDPVYFPVDGGRVFMLLPTGADVIGDDVTGIDFLQTWSNKSESQNFLQLLYDAINRIEFEFYCTPKGDLVVEFPLYDFNPRDFGIHERKYIVELDDQFASSSTFSDAAVRTIAVVSPSPTENIREGNALRANLSDVVVKLSSMFPVYGARAETGNMKGRIRTMEAARLYAHILLNKVNADAHSVGLPIVPRFGCGLNRPYIWKLRNHIGTSVEVSHAMAWNGGWRTTLGLHYMRGWTGMMTTDHNMVYTPLAGQASRPINYRVLFGVGVDESVTPSINQTETSTAAVETPTRASVELPQLGPLAPEETGDVTE